jgi:hypothetical protein
MAKAKFGVLIDFDGVISKTSVRLTIDFVHQYINSIKPISYNFIENYVKSVLCFPVEDSVKLLFNSLGLEKKLADFFNEFKKLDSDNTKIKIENSFYNFIDFCNFSLIEYRILSLASEERLRLIENVNQKSILKVEYSKANPKTYENVKKALQKVSTDWIHIDDSPLALRASKQAKIETIMMLNDVFTSKEYQFFKEYIDYKVSNFNGIKLILNQKMQSAKSH